VTRAHVDFRASFAAPASTVRMPTMSDSQDNSEPTTTTTSSDESGNKILNRIIKRFGGRHLIFRTQLGEGFRIIPKPYALVSTFRGPVWFFYGLGQVWITHKKYHDFDGWMARIPRISADKVTKLLDKLENQISEFTHHCNEHGIEGTILVEPTTIEFHWTFGHSLEKEKMKDEASNILDDQFQKLVDAFLIAKEQIG
jgi:hypothetical protein